MAFSHLWPWQENMSGPKISYSYHPDGIFPLVFLRQLTLSTALPWFDFAKCIPIYGRPTISQAASELLRGDNILGMLKGLREAEKEGAIIEQRVIGKQRAI